jgi:hypothetical protein
MGFVIATSFQWMEIQLLQIECEPAAHFQPTLRLIAFKDLTRAEE